MRKKTALALMKNTKLYIKVYYDNCYFSQIDQFCIKLGIEINILIISKNK